MLEFELPKDHVFLIVDDGTDLLPALVDRFRTLAWPMVVIRPSDVVPAAGAAVDVPTDIPVLPLDEASETAVIAVLEKVRDTWGPIAGCAVLCAPGAEPPLPDGEGADILADLGRRDRVRLPFLLAKHLERSLTEAARRGWGGFFTVTRLDGTLGFAGTTDRPSATSGLTGLIKTLRLEWPTVGCRAIDLGPEMASGDAAAALVGEIRDPNRMITEVGWQRLKRVTLVAEAARGAEEMVDGV